MKRTPNIGAGLHRCASSGITFIELLVVLTITTVTLSFAMPGFDQMLTRSRTTGAVNRLVGAVNFTRHTAVSYRTMTTLCALKPSGQCGANWEGMLTVFLDRNHNARLEAEDSIIHRVNPVSDGTRVRWRAFQNKQYLQMTPWGYTNFQNGNFVICPDSLTTANARQLVINIQGRARINRRTNSQGWPVDSRGKLLKC